MVCENVEPADRLSSTTSKEKTTTDTAIQNSRAASIGRQNEVDGMPLIRQRFQEYGLSQQAQDIMLASWREKTRKQYGVYIRKWVEFASRRNCSSTHPNVAQLIDFLTEQYQSGIGYSALSTARSALSAIITLPGQVQVGDHPMVRRFIKGVYQLKPNFPRYQRTWDTSIVLQYLETLYPNSRLSLKDLTLKLVMLVALVTGQRGQSIFLMDLKDMTQRKNSYTFVISTKVKQSAPGRIQPVLKLCEFKENRKLCVVRTLTEYLARTRGLRKDDCSKLFITYIAPHRAATRDTVSRWVRTVMLKAGIDVDLFRPHSTRAASTSKAFGAHVPLATILKTAGWSTENTFAKFYNKPMDTGNKDFVTAVLDPGKKQ